MRIIMAIGKQKNANFIKRITKRRMLLRKVNMKMQAVIKMYANNHSHE